MPGKRGRLNEGPLGTVSVDFGETVVTPGASLPTLRTVNSPPASRSFSVFSGSGSGSGPDRETAAAMATSQTLNALALGSPLSGSQRKPIFTKQGKIELDHFLTFLASCHPPRGHLPVFFFPESNLKVNSLLSFFLSSFFFFLLLSSLFFFSLQRSLKVWCTLLTL